MLNTSVATDFLAFLLPILKIIFGIIYQLINLQKKLKIAKESSYKPIRGNVQWNFFNHNHTKHKIPYDPYKFRIIPITIIKNCNGVG